MRGPKDRKHQPPLPVGGGAAARQQLYEKERGVEVERPEKRPADDERCDEVPKKKPEKPTR